MGHERAEVTVKAGLVQGCIGAVLYRSSDEERSTRAHYAAYNRKIQIVTCMLSPCLPQVSYPVSIMEVKTLVRTPARMDVNNTGLSDQVLLELQCARTIAVGLLDGCLQVAAHKLLCGKCS